MTSSSRLRRLDRSGSAGHAEEPFLETEREPSVLHQRFTRFLPEQRGQVEPVVGLASDPLVVRALALAGRGWINKDGRILTAGSCKNEDVLSVLPETAAIVERFENAEAALRDLRDECVEESLALHLSKGRSQESFTFSHGAFNVDHRTPFLHDFLDEAGWLEVDLLRDEGVRKVFCDVRLTEESVAAYRDVVVALGESLRCRVVHGGKDGNPELLFDPTDNDGLGYRDPKPLAWPGMVRDRDNRDITLWTSRSDAGDEDLDGDDARPFGGM
ncbi:hypothetical protein [Methylorubrum thiocyanatum]|uniref:hypothetical protein n=1 Tax=Methylorubrum thiocyanatum TaxID=47958 RepID=UPI00398C5849